VISAVACLVVSFCYLAQLDWLAPVTLVPTWFWVIPGTLLAICGFSPRHKLSFISVFVLWGVFIVFFVEEARSVVRISNSPTAEWQAARERGRGIRVVSLNCNVGQTRCVDEAAAWNPDIVLIQESPGNEGLEHLSRVLFGADGAFLNGGDVSILARGQIQPKYSNRGSHFVHAELELPTGVRTNVISVRLAPPVFRLDFWTRRFWIEHRDKRIQHRKQILEIMQHIQGTPKSQLLIVGGDFNSPPYDDALAPLQQRLFDTFQQAGHGWGATGTNDYPLFRVDQIWVSQGFQADSVRAQKTLHSDHRMVVCDLMVKD
jgi:endonuclease/exonuclease/phosphatase family metal-dependent hydrolase